MSHCDFEGWLGSQRSGAPQTVHNESSVRRVPRVARPPVPTPVSHRTGGQAASGTRRGRHHLLRISDFGSRILNSLHGIWN